MRVHIMFYEKQGVKCLAAESNFHDERRGASRGRTRFFSDLLGFRSNRAMQEAERDKRRAEWRAEALVNFPFEIMETTGANGVAKWRELKDAGSGECPLPKGAGA
jgi:hypothetical protein